jgi:hypothetical protein
LDNNLATAARRANALFKKEEKAREGIEAWAEYSARQAATRQKTVRLRELRLANELRELRLANELREVRLAPEGAGSKNRKAPSKSRKRLARVLQFGV